MVPAPMVGTEAAYVYYSGPAEVLRSHEAVLVHIGTPRYVGRGPRPGAALYQAQLAVFLTALVGLLQAAAIASRGGVRAGDLAGRALDTWPASREMLDGERDRGARSRRRASRQPEHGAMMGATADHIVRTSDAAGVDTALPSAIKSHYTGRSPPATAATTGPPSTRSSSPS